MPEPKAASPPAARRGTPTQTLTAQRGVILLLTLAGCVAPDFSGLFGGTDYGGSYSCSIPSLSLVPPYDGFTPVCPADPDAGDDGGGSVATLDAGGLVFAVHPASDFNCIFAGGPGSGTTNVAVGAPFQLEYILPGDAGAPLPVGPAAPSFVQSTPQGWVFPREEYASFVAWSGSKALDYEHLQAREVAAVSSFAVGLGCLTGFAPAVDGGPNGCSVPVGAPVTVVALLEDDGGTPLAGSFECTFVSSDPSVLAVVGSGIVARATAMAPGTAALTLTCDGFSNQVAFTVSEEAADASLDGSADGEAGSGDDGPGPGADVEVGPADAQGPSDGGADGPDSGTTEGG
jgi:hypothetical protein